LWSSSGCTQELCEWRGRTATTSALGHDARKASRRWVFRERRGGVWEDWPAHRRAQSPDLAFGLSIPRPLLPWTVPLQQLWHRRRRRAPSSEARKQPECSRMRHEQYVGTVLECCLTPSRLWIVQRTLATRTGWRGRERGWRAGRRGSLRVPSKAARLQEGATCRRFWRALGAPGHFLHAPARSCPAHDAVQ
jgi:hypothetical protein